MSLGFHLRGVPLSATHEQMTLFIRCGIHVCGIEVFIRAVLRQRCSLVRYRFEVVMRVVFICAVLSFQCDIQEFMDNKLFQINFQFALRHGTL